MIGFTAVVLTVLGALHWYLWQRLVRDVSRPGGWYRRVGTVVVVVLPVLVVLTMVGGQLGLPFPVRQVVSWPGYYWLAGLLYLVPCLLLGEVVRHVVLRRSRAAADRGPVAARTAPEPVVAGAAAAGGGAASGAGTAAAAATAAATGGATGGADTSRAGVDAADGPDGLTRRRLVARAVAVGAGAVTAGTLGYGSHAARRLRTRHVTVRLAGLPRAAHGYRIAVASDIHLGPVAGRSHCQRVVDAINATQPDLITVVGDLVDAGVDDLRSAAAPLARLGARDGAFFVTGNHEYYVDTQEWIDHVRELGLVVLENERRELPYFDLAGVNDLDGEGSDHGGPDFDAALGDRDPNRTAVLMSHQPATIHDAVAHGVDLQLSGHTHGGQLWPATYLADLANPTLAGLERYGDTQLYVTRGAGAWGPPVRVGADPDVTVITFASPEA